MPIEDFDLIIKVHLLGTSYMTHAAWPVMYQNGYGRIVLTSSISGIFGMFGQSAYGCAKMSMLGLMNVLALEGKTHNIRVNCLAPGADTRMTALDKELGIDPDNPRENMHPRLISPAAHWLMNSSFGNDRNVLKMMGPATVTCHPQTASDLGIGDGDRVRLSNELGELVLTACLSDMTTPGALIVYKSRWLKAEKGRSNVNRLCITRKTDMGESTSVHATEVTVSRVD